MPPFAVLIYLTLLICFTHAHRSEGLHSHKRTTSTEVKVASAELLGELHSRTTFVRRDGGSSGSIGKYVLLAFSDTIYSDANYSDKWYGFISNSITFASHDPLLCVDSNLNAEGYPQQFLLANASLGETNPNDWAFWPTNVVETQADQGILYYLVTSRPDKSDPFKGTGIATISLDTSVYPPVVQASRVGPRQYWWKHGVEPTYGDVCALRWKDHIYAYGHGPNGQLTYLARVPWQSATILSAYEYWNGETWQQEALKGDSLARGSVFTWIQSGQIFWSNYHHKFFLIELDIWGDNKVSVETADRPEGPWSSPITLYTAKPLKANEGVYAAAAHPYFDPTGKALVITFSNTGVVRQVIKVVS